MSPQLILIVQIIIVFVTIICAVRYATAWVAAELAYDAYLGPAWHAESESDTSRKYIKVLLHLQMEPCLNMTAMQIWYGRGQSVSKGLAEQGYII
ncbi:MAG: hypothetical protein COA69_14235 [Robiginitomaculum sp.]|nr:MAG: hypothetical protein COA69_14235 [Robiginitomaculum sp.]